MVFGIIVDGFAHLADGILQRLGDSSHRLAVLLLQLLRLGIHQLLRHVLQLLASGLQLLLELLFAQFRLLAEAFLALAALLVETLFCLLLFLRTLLREHLHFRLLASQLHMEPSHLRVQQQVDCCCTNGYTYYYIYCYHDCKDTNTFSNFQEKVTSVLSGGVEFGLTSLFRNLDNDAPRVSCLYARSVIIA